MKENNFEYFTAAEANQYTFYRIPKALFTDGRFGELSCEAKVLYGMMLDRMGLSIKNQWLDSEGRVYIVFTVEDVMAVMGCGSQKAVRLIKELDAAEGIGLIEKKRVGLGRPNRIYVKNFMVRENGGSDTNGGSRQNTSGQDASGRQDTSGRQERASVHENEETASDAREQEREQEMDDTPLYLEDSVMDESVFMANAVMNASAHMEMEFADSEADAGNAVFVPEAEKAGETETDDAHERNWWELETDAGNGQDDPLCAAPLEKCAAFAKSENERMPDEIWLEEMQPEENWQAAGASAVEYVDIVDNVDKMGTAGNIGIVDAVENVDNCCQAAAYENRNTGRHPLVPDRKNCPVERKFADEEIRKMFAKEPDFPEAQKLNAGNQDSLMAQSENAEWRDAKCNKTDITKTEDSKTEDIEADGIKTEKNETDYPAGSFNQSYQSSCQPRDYSVQRYGRRHMDKKRMPGDEMAKMDSYRSCIRENICYSCVGKDDVKDVDELVELMVDTMMAPDGSPVRIGREERPASIVKSQFMKLKLPHIEYILWSLRRHTGKIYNITALKGTFPIFQFGLP